MKEIIVGKQNKQKEAFNDFIKALEVIIPTIKKFDGKVVNVKLDRELKEVTPSPINIYLNVNEKKIKLMTSNRHFSYSNSRTEYIDCDTVVLYLGDKDILSESKRLNSDALINLIKSKITYLQNEILVIDKGIEDYDNMVKEYDNLVSKIKEFNNKYDYSIRHDTRCLFNKNTY